MEPGIVPVNKLLDKERIFSSLPVNGANRYVKLPMNPFPFSSNSLRRLLLKRDGGMRPVKLLYERMSLVNLPVVALASNEPKSKLLPMFRMFICVSFRKQEGSGP